MSDLKLYEELFEGVSEDDLTLIPDISNYNRNYYIYKGRLLYLASDDDNFTQWYWINGPITNTIGGSYCSDGDTLIIDYAYT